MCLGGEKTVRKREREPSAAHCDAWMALGTESSILKLMSVCALQLVRDVCTSLRMWQIMAWCFYQCLPPNVLDFGCVVLRVAGPRASHGHDSRLVSATDVVLARYNLVTLLVCGSPNFVIRFSCKLYVCVCVCVRPTVYVGTQQHVPSADCAGTWPSILSVIVHKMC